MKPIPFEGTNAVFGKEQEEYKNLPAFVNGGDVAEVVTCWNLTFWERLRLLFTGKVWLMVMTFKEKLQPCYLTTYKDEIFDSSVTESKKIF